MVVHHDLPTARNYFDQLLLLNMRVVAYGDTEDVFTYDLLQKTYGGQLTILSEVADAVRQRANDMCSRRKTLPSQGLGGCAGLLALGLLLPECAWAAKIECGGGISLANSFAVPVVPRSAVRYAVAGAVLLGISCGLLGCFIVVRKMALVATPSRTVSGSVAWSFSGVDASGLLDWDFDVNSIRKNPTLIFIGAGRRVHWHCS